MLQLESCVLVTQTGQVLVDLGPNVFQTLVKTSFWRNLLNFVEQSCHIPNYFIK